MMHPDEAAFREALDLARAEFERAKANCASIEAAVDAALALQEEAENEYNRLSNQVSAHLRAASRAFADGDDCEPVFGSNRELEEANAEFERCMSNATTFNTDLHKVNLAKSAASKALDCACYDVIKAHVASETARANDLAAELQSILPLLAAADGTEYAEPEANRTALLQKYSHLPPYPSVTRSSLWLWCEALKTDSNATLELCPSRAQLRIRNVLPAT